MNQQALFERALLDEIRRKTGLSFSQLAEIDTQSKPIADAVLPILKEWFPLATDQSYRGIIYYKFATIHAATFIEVLLEWWQHESDEVDASWLTQAIVRAARPIQAENIWRVAQGCSTKPFYFMLLSKLAGFPKSPPEIRQSLVASLQAGLVPPYELQYVAKVDDPSIRKWFEENVDSPDAKVRLVARRVVARGKKLPASVAVSPIPPDRSLEVFSTELDLADARVAMKRIADRFGLRLSSTLKNLTFMSSVGIDQWVHCETPMAKRESADIWLRLEDSDTIEVAVLRRKSAPTVVE